MIDDPLGTIIGEMAFVVDQPIARLRCRCEGEHLCHVDRRPHGGGHFSHGFFLAMDGPEEY